MTNTPKVKKQSSLFLKNVSCLDHAWCSITRPVPLLGKPELSDYQIQGGSFMVSVLVTGEVTEDEHVVVDFSTIKKDIKHIIDHPSEGLDHKLWVFPKMFGCEFKEGANGGEYVTLTNPATNLYLPSSDVAIIGEILRPELNRLEGECTEYLEYSKENATRIVQTLLQTTLQETYPGIKVDVILSEEPDFLEIPGMLRTAIKFRYTHGLKDSTSEGCQNIAHGHLSYLALYYPESVPVQNRPSPDLIVESGILNPIAGCTLIYDANLLGGYCTYHTPRGKFSLEMVCPAIGYSIFPEETTIENLLDNLLTPEIKAIFLEKGVAYVAISEGLQKGSIIKL